MLPIVLAFATMIAPIDPPDKPPSEPPVRLKKKSKTEAPKAETKPESKSEKRSETLPKSETQKPDTDTDTETLNAEQKLKETMDRLTRNLRQADERLGKDDPGKETQQVMSDIVKDLDELIEATKRQSQQQQQQSSSTSSRKQQQRDRRRQQNASEQNQQSPSQANQQAQGRATLARGGNAKPGETSQLADLYKDIWGHLPETLRQEMNQYSREQFMAKYGDLLKQYYTTIAEKGRHKGE
jgi:hypothetical protein